MSTAIHRGALTPYAGAGTAAANPLAASLVPAGVCLRLRAMPLAIRGRTVIVGMADPADRRALETVHEIVNQRVRARVAAVFMDEGRMRSELHRLSGPGALGGAFLGDPCGERGTD